MARAESPVRTDSLTRVVEELKSNPHNPELVTASFRTIWQARAEQLKRVGVEITLPEAGYTEEKLKQLEAEGRRPGYLPPELATQEARHLMALIWPEMGSFSVLEGNVVTNEENRSGWFDYEVAIDAPFTKTRESGLRKAIKKQGRAGMNMNEYIVAGQDSKLLKGYYLDEGGTWARLLGSRLGNNVVYVFFSSKGHLGVSSFRGPWAHQKSLGGRSVEAPEKA